MVLGETSKLLGCRGRFFYSYFRFDGCNPIVNELFTILYDKAKELFKHDKVNDGIDLYVFLLSKVGIQLIVVIEQLTRFPLSISNPTKALELCCICTKKVMDLPMNFMASSTERIPQEIAPFIKIVFESLNESLKGAKSLNIDTGFIFNSDFTQLGAYDEAPTGSLAYYFLSIIGNLVENGQTLENLTILSELAEMLKIRQRTINYGTLTLHRQTIRTFLRISKLLSGTKFIKAFNDQGIMKALIEATSDPHKVPGVYTLEVAQLIVTILRTSCTQSNLLLNNFFDNGGYRAFLNNIVYLSNNGTKDQHGELLFIFANFLFFYNVNEAESLVLQKRFFNTLLSLYLEVKSTESRNNILKIIYQMLKLDKNFSDVFKDGVLKILFTDFDSMNLYNRFLVLKIMKCNAHKIGMHDSDLEIYSEMLRDGKPSTILLMSKHLSKLIKSKKVGRSKLRDVGVGENLTKYIDLPVTHSMKYILKKDPEELRSCLAVISGTIESVFDAERIKQLPQTQTELDLIEDVVYNIVLRILDLMDNYLTENTYGQEDIRTGDTTPLLNLIHNPQLRGSALRILSTIAIGDILCQSSIVNDLIKFGSYINDDDTCQDISKGKVEQICELIGTINDIMSHNENVKSRFCADGGFEWGISCINKSQNSTFDVFDAQRISVDALNMIGIAINGHEANLLHFKKLQQILSESFIKSKNIYNPGYVSVLCDTLLHNSLVMKNSLKDIDRHALLQRLESPEHESEIYLIDHVDFVKVVIYILGNNNETPEDENLDFEHERVFLETLNCLKLILISNPQNLEIASSNDLALYILTTMKSIILKEKLSLRSSKRQVEVLSILESINTFSITTLQFRKYIELIRTPHCPHNVLESLTSISKVSHIPVSYIKLTKKDSSIQIHNSALKSMAWPPRKGYSISLWVNIEAFHEKAFPLVSIQFTEKSKNIAVSISISKDSVIVSQGDEVDYVEFKFKDAILEEKKWYNLVFSHSPAEDAKADLLALYINGLKNGEIPFPYLTSRSKRKVNCIIGQNQRNDCEFSEHSFCLSNLYIFRYKLMKDTDALMLYLLGANYVGKFENLYQERYACPDVIASPYLDVYKDSYETLLHPDIESILYLSKKMVFMFNPKDMTFIIHEGQYDVAPIVSKEVYQVCRYTLSDVINYSGGLSVLLYFLATSQSKAQMQCALKLIRNVLKWNAFNISQMSTLGGYGIISRVLRKMEWTIDEDTLAIVFDIVGFQKSKNRFSYSDGVLQNIDAFRALLLDWKIWIRAPDAIRILLFKSISDSLIVNNYIDFNVYRMKEAKIRASLVMLLEEDTFPFHLAQHVVSTLSHLMERPWCQSDIEALVKFLIASHALPKENSENCPLSIQHHTVYFSGMICGLRPTLQNLRPSQNFLTFESGTTYALDVRVQGEESETRPIRDLVLILILDTLLSANQDTITSFFKTCTQEIMLALLQTPIESTQILILNLIKIALSIKPFEAKFKRTGGYALLGQVLRRHSTQEELFSELFSMLLSRPVNFKSLRATVMTYFNNDEPLHLNSDAVIPLLLLVTSCHVTSRIQHVVIKVLHDIFLHCDSAKEAMLKSNIIEYLCNIFVMELDHRVGKVIHPNNNNEKVNVEYIIEEDTLLFLKTIVLFGLDKGHNTLQETMQSIHCLPIPYSYSCALQKRVLFDALEFYLNSTFNHADTITTFQKTVTFSISSILFLDKSVYVKRYPFSKLKLPPRPSSPSYKESPRNIAVKKFDSSMRVGSLTSPHSHSLKSKFWEILQSVDDVEEESLNYSDVKAIDEEETSFDYLQDEVVLDSTDDFNHIDTEKGEDELVDDFDPQNTEALQEVVMDAWINNDYLVSDKDIIDLLFKVFHKYLLNKTSQSTLRKISETLRHKMVGISSMENVSTNVSWHLERLIHHYLKKKKSHVTAEVVELIMKRVVELDVAKSFLSETEFYMRFLFYSSRFIGEEGFSCAQYWKKILYSAPSKILEKIFVNLPQLLQTSTLTAEMINFPDKIRDRIRKIESVDTILSNQWHAAWSKKIEEVELFSDTEKLKVKNLVNACSTGFITMQQMIIKPLIEYVRMTIEAEKKVRSNWKKLIKRVTRERGAWPIHRSLMRWVLDPTEGPLRMKHRLMPLYIHKHPIIGGDSNINDHSRDPRLAYSSNLVSDKVLVLKALEAQLNEDELDIELSLQYESVHSKERIVSSMKCSKITPFHKRDGELLIGEYNIYFIDSHKFADQEEELNSYTSVKKDSSFPYEEIREIHKRKHMLMNTALEIFFITGKTFMIAFKKKTERDEIYASLLKMNLPNYVNYESELFLEGKLTKMSITQKWQRGIITNFEYLMHLNTLAGRTFNDLTQYPVFPFVLSDYCSEELDLTSIQSFRDLSKPMGAQEFKGTARLLKFIEKYQLLLDLKEKPYFYGTHYSNIGSVLHFLIRLEPFSQYFVEFQGGKFDVPDRMFHSIGQSWELSSSQSQSDVKELIPEFFFMPDFLINSNGFNFGSKQDGTRVNDIILPPWAKNSQRMFINKHIESLESHHVSMNLHHWIDLIFGYKQNGEEAVKARNLFHPYTYEGAVDIDKIDNPIDRDAIITQINSYGQTPTQLFKKPHPKRSENYLKRSRPENIYSAPDKIKYYKLFDCGEPSRVHFLSGYPMSCKMNEDLLWPGNSQLIQWGNWDGAIRVLSMKTHNVDYEIEFPMNIVETLLSAEVSKNGRLIVAGSESSLVYIWKKTYDYTRKDLLQQKLAVENELGELNSQVNSLTIIPIASAPTPQVRRCISEYSFSCALDGHTDAVTCVKISTDQSVIATGGRDRVVIIWDSNRLRYCRSFSNFEGPIVAIEIVKYNADVVVVDHNKDKGCSNISIYSINGDFVAKKTCEHKIGVIAVTTGKPGISRNVVISGHENGELNLWSAFDLDFITSLESPHKHPIVSLALNEENTCFISCDESGTAYSHTIKQN